MGAARWEHFSHGADIGVRGIGNSKAQAFEQAALALTAVIIDPDAVEARTVLEFFCVAPDDELLLTDWLNALVYAIATQEMVFSRYTVHPSNHRLVAQAWGEEIDPGRHQLTVEVKGATYTELSVRQEPPGTWVAQCVVDV